MFDRVRIPAHIQTMERQNQPPQLFDRSLLDLRRKRAAGRFHDHNFLHRMIVEDVVDRLETVTRTFPLGLATGPGARLIRETVTAKCGIEELITADVMDKTKRPNDPSLLLDEEKFPLAPQSLDLMVSLMSLHMINDLPGTLFQIRQSLKPDGLFIAALPGENTLQELRACLYQAETEITGGVSPRVIPFAAIRDLGGLMQRAGFALPVADIIRYPVTYRDPMRLLHDLRYMGETNVLYARKLSTLRSDVLERMLEIYRETFPAGKAGGVKASFEIIMLTGWAPHPDQQKSLRPGSAKVSMEQAVRDNPD